MKGQGRKRDQPAQTRTPPFPPSRNANFEYSIGAIFLPVAAAAAANAEVLEEMKGKWEKEKEEEEEALESRSWSWQRRRKERKSGGGGGGGLRVNGTTTTTGVNIGGRTNEPGRELEVEKEDIGYSPNIDSSNNTYL